MDEWMDGWIPFLELFEGKRCVAVLQPMPLQRFDFVAGNGRESQDKIKISITIFYMAREEDFCIGLAIGVVVLPAKVPDAGGCEAL